MQIVILDLLFTFFSNQGEVTKIPSAHISLTYMHVFCSPYWLFFCLINFEKKKKYESTRYGFSSVWFPVLILIRTILEQSINNKMLQNGEQNLSWNVYHCVYYWYVYTNAKFIIICKPRTLNDGGEDSVKYRNRKKHSVLLNISHFAFYW